MGPREWIKTSVKLMNKNLLLTQAFQSVAELLIKHKDNTQDGHIAPICGHSCVYKLFLFYPADIATLQAHQMNMVSQIFYTHLSRAIDETVSPTLTNELLAFPLLRHKIQTFVWSFRRKPFRNKYASPRTNLTTLMNLDTNLNHRYKLLCHEILDKEIRVAPVY
jgi:hypothetical protein